MEFEILPAKPVMARSCPAHISPRASSADSRRSRAPADPGAGRTELSRGPAFTQKMNPWATQKRQRSRSPYPATPLTVVDPAPLLLRGNLPDRALGLGRPDGELMPLSRRDQGTPRLGDDSVATLFGDPACPESLRPGRPRTADHAGGLPRFLVQDGITAGAGGNDTDDGRQDGYAHGRRVTTTTQWAPIEVPAAALD